MPYYEKRIYSGKVLEIERYYCTNGGRRPRSDRGKPTSEAQHKRNIINSKKKLTRLINTNFHQGDLYITLTYAILPTEEQAKRELEKFFRKLRDYRKKAGMGELKYISITEKDEKRVHHHLLVNSISMDVIEKLWQLGRLTVSRLDPDFEYEWLARYLGKEEKPNSKRWNQSRNLKKPKEKTKEIKRIVLKGEPTPPKGYKLLSYSPVYCDLTGIAEYSKFVKLEVKAHDIHRHSKN